MLLIFAHQLLLRKSLFAVTMRHDRVCAQNCASRFPRLSRLFQTLPAQARSQPHTREEEVMVQWKELGLGDSHLGVGAQLCHTLTNKPASTRSLHLSEPQILPV